MEGLTFSTPEENAITASVVIRRPVRAVFGFCRDFTNLPRFLGDVMEVEQLDPVTSRWTNPRPVWSSDSLEDKGD